MNQKTNPHLLQICFFIIIFLFPVSLLSDVQVYFNVNTYKVHKLSCHSGRSCTKSCIIMSRSKAYEQGGVACKNCGG